MKKYTVKIEHTQGRQVWRVGETRELSEHDATPLLQVKFIAPARKAPRKAYYVQPAAD